MELSDQIAIVTGGASGLGAAVVDELRKSGTKIAIFDKNISQCQYNNSKSILAIQCDVTETKDLSKALQYCENKLGNPRIIVNCAGIASGQLLLNKVGEPTSLDDFNKVITSI